MTDLWSAMAEQKTQTGSNGKVGSVVVVGGGIGGMRSALDLADAGLKVYLIEQTPCLGGRVAQLGYMFESKHPFQLLNRLSAMIPRHCE